MGTESKAKRPSNRSTSKLVAVRMPNEIHGDLFRLAKLLNISTSQIVINATREKLAEVESNLIVYGQLLSGNKG